MFFQVFGGAADTDTAEGVGGGRNSEALIALEEKTRASYMHL